MKPVFLIILSLTLLSACNNKPEQPKTLEETVAEMPKDNMNAGKQRYTLYTPIGWTTENKTANGIDYYFLFAPKTLDDPNTSMNVVTEYMQNFSLDEFLTKTIALLKKTIPGVTIFSQGSINANTLKGAWVTYSMEVRGVRYSIICYIFPKDGVAYIITGGTQPKDAKRYRNTFDLVAQSLTFEE